MINAISREDETRLEKLRSIMAQLEYQYRMNAYESQVIPFKHHLYMPEVHPITQIGFCELEDEGHVLKVCLVCFKYYLNINN